MPETHLESYPMPKIVLVTGGLDCGGAQRVIADIANYWGDRGWRVTLATWSGPELPDFYALSANVSRVWLHVESSGLPVIGRLSAFASRLLRLRKVLRGTRPDAVVSFIDVSNVHTIFASAGLGVRVVVSERTHPGFNRTVSRSWGVLRRLCYAWADQVVAQTRDAANWIERRCETPVLIIPNFVRELPKVSAPREPLIIAVGRLSAEKGFELLLASFARVRTQFPQWRLCFIGEGPERRALTELAARLSMQDRVEFIGQVRDVEMWMARAGLVVHPSRREGFPNVVLEAMAMGAAVLCTDCHSGPSELIEDGVNGRLVPVDDLDALTRAMAQLMADPKGRERLGEEAAKVRQRFSKAELMEQWEACVLSPSALRAYKSTQLANPG
jgi:GalNAc-alpha-(1->4)-GalNAc-alpha-(1->3)-diNAcBac-PP-undecaprenol alpha-1,4-N-acetyl-D-galactosaminyltransferase